MMMMMMMDKGKTTTAGGVRRGKFPHFSQLHNSNPKHNNNKSVVSYNANSVGVGIRRIILLWINIVGNIEKDEHRAISISQCGWGECRNDCCCCESIKLWFGKIGCALSSSKRRRRGRPPIQFNVRMVSVWMSSLCQLATIPKGITDPSIKNKFQIFLSPDIFFFIRTQHWISLSFRLRERYDFIMCVACRVTPLLLTLVPSYADLDGIGDSLQARTVTWKI